MQNGFSSSFGVSFCVLSAPTYFFREENSSVAMTLEFLGRKNDSGSLLSEYFLASLLS